MQFARFLKAFYIPNSCFTNRLKLDQTVRKCVCAYRNPPHCMKTVIERKRLKMSTNDLRASTAVGAGQGT